MNTYQIKHYTHKLNQYTVYGMIEIFIVGETYWYILIQKCNLCYTSSYPLFRDFMKISGSEWEEYKYFQ